TITVNPVEGNAQIASTTYTEFAREVQPGDRILLADGALVLRAKESDGTSVLCEVVSGGPISDNKGINLPGVRLSVPALTEKDLDDLKHGLDAGVDFIALSFVRTAADVAQLKQLMAAYRANIPVIAKFEKPEALDNINE